LEGTYQPPDRLEAAGPSMKNSLFFCISFLLYLYFTSTGKYHTNTSCFPNITLCSWMILATGITEPRLTEKGHHNIRGCPLGPFPEKNR
jgi:hypothetical protein